MKLTLPATLEDLRDAKRWVSWRYEEANGRRTKVPFSGASRRAKSDDPRTWTTFDKLPQGDGFEGPGLMLGDGLQGIDLDMCLDATGELEPWARPIVQRFGGYVEISPSGWGLKLYFYGPPGNSAQVSFGEPVKLTPTEHKGREVAYSTGARYFAVTGNVWRDEPLRQVAEDEVTWLRTYVEDLRQTEKARKERSAFDTGSSPLERLPGALARLIRDGVSEGHRSEQFYRAVLWCRQCGMSADETTARMEEHPEGIAHKYAGRVQREVERCLEESAQAVAGVEAIAIAAEKGDTGAPFEPSALGTLRALKAQDVAQWVRYRDRLRKAGVRVTELDRHLRDQAGAPSEQDETAADRLIALARDRCRFVHDAQNDAFAIFQVLGARHVLNVMGSAFTDYLAHEYYTEHDRAPGEQSMRSALATLRGQAIFDGDQGEVFTRVSRSGDAYWLDLCDERWHCVKITETGWEVVAGEAAPLFARSASMRPLPTPQRGGSLDALWPLLNIPEAARLLTLAWLLESMRPETPHVVLELVGEQGSAKSSTQRTLRRLIDPNQADLRTAPKTVEDVWIAAQNGHVVSLENMSHLSASFQDTLCALATGGGYSTRTLYTNVEETIVNVCRPIVLNGISVIATAQDLVDRSLHIELPVIEHREFAGELESRFEASWAELLGALLDLFANVLAVLPTVSIDPAGRPRMADFALLGEAVYRVHGQPAGAFLSAYQDMRSEGVRRTLDASPVGVALVAYLEANPDGFTGELGALLPALFVHRPIGDSSWPKSPKGLGDALRRLAPALRMLGFECRSAPKTGGIIRWHIVRKVQPA